MEKVLTENEIISMTNDVFAESFEIEREKLLPDMHIFEDLGLDSLDVVDLVVALQQKFGVKIRSDERIMEVRTLGDVYGLIQVLKAEVNHSNNDI